MKSQHTPGPWTAWGCTIYTDSGYRVAQTWDQDRCCLPTPTMEADARLIASAPDLLVALERIESSLGHEPGMYSDILSIARAAIAKAKGL
jgi:hypothetical protein